MNYIARPVSRPITHSITRPVNRIGYFIPEFPGQTHIFFWRERQALMELGIETVLLSTRRPPQGIVSHSWAAVAQQQTQYLLPLKMLDSLLGLGKVLQAGPKAWARCARAIATAQVAPLQRLHLAVMLLAAGKLVRLMQQQGIHHVHVHSCANAANVAMLASLMSDITYSMTLHGPGLAVYGPNQPQKWQHAQFALVISEELRALVQRELARSLPALVVVAPMGVDVDQIRRSRPYQSAPLEGPFHLVSCGRLNPVKGHADLIQSVANLRQQGLDIYLRIAGEDESGGEGYHLELLELIRKLQLEEYVTLLGAISEAQVRQELELAHVFTLASLNEGVPVAVMEAMAMEIPVIVTGVGGMAELVEPGRDGVLVQAENVTMLTQAIAQMLCDPDFAMRLSQASRQKVVSQFSHRRSAEAIAACLAQTHSPAAVPALAHSTR
jgi:colanic acid/amylovoran biosynthesis glycosyltransferase